MNGVDLLVDKGAVVDITVWEVEGDGVGTGEALNVTFFNAEGKALLTATLDPEAVEFLVSELRRLG